MKNSKWTLGVLLVICGVAGLWRLNSRVHPRVDASTAEQVAPGIVASNSPALLAMQAALRGQPTTPPPPPSVTYPTRRIPVPAAASVPTPEAIAHDFKLWAERFAAARQSGGESPALAEGLRLAILRRQALAGLIRSNPEEALKWAMPWGTRQQLPAAVAQQLESPVSGRGDLEVYCADPKPGEVRPDGGETTIRYIQMGAKRYKAYVYGRRLHEISHRGIALHGIALDGEMAVHEGPLRQLDAAEATARTAAGKGSAIPTCQVCGAPVAGGQAILADFAGTTLAYCGDAHFEANNRTLARTENRRAVPRATGGGQPTNTPPISPEWSLGTKRLLYMRVIFQDDITEPATEDGAYSDLNKVCNFYLEASFGKTAIIPTVSPLLMLPFGKLYYMSAGPGALLEDARTVSKQAGLDTAAFDLDVVSFTPVPGKSFNFGGLGAVGGKGTWVQFTGPGVLAHELGHNYGLLHANFWDTRRNTPLPTGTFDQSSLVGHESMIGPGEDAEYGDPFDVMGSGSDEPSNRTNTVISSISSHFNPIGKYDLDWLPVAYVNFGAVSGTNRLYVHDVPNLVDGRSYAVVVPKDAAARGNDRNYWISARYRTTDPHLLNGVLLHWDAWQQSDRSGDLIDTTPGTAAGKMDSPLLVGRTFADPEADVYITPVAKGGVLTNTFFDVVVNYGPFSNNVPPTLDLTASRDTVPVGVPVTFRAAASDPNGDAMSIFWDFGDGTFSSGLTNITKSWNNAGDYVVRCEASDMRGGVASKHLVISVGVNTNAVFHISGRVIDGDGNPLQGVVVHNGQLTADDAHDYAPDYQSTLTDSDGAYTLVNISNGVYQVGAYIYRYVTAPLSFGGAGVTVADGDVTGADFMARQQTRIGIQTISNAVALTAAPGVFRLTRTGDTNTQLHAVFLVGGTAGSKQFAISNSVDVQTNLNGTSPFGAKTNSYKFLYADFQTGAVTTDITIYPAQSSLPAADLTVELSLMAPLQVTNIEVLSDSSGNLTTNYTATLCSGWETKNINGQDLIFQTYPGYVPGFAPYGEASATALIKNSAPPLPVVAIQVYDPNVTEAPGDAGTFLISRYGALDKPLTIKLQTGGSAVPVAEYEPLPSTVTIPAGLDFVLVPVHVTTESYLDGIHSVDVTLVPDSAYSVGTATASVSILDNDMPLVYIEASVGLTVEGSNTGGTFLVTRIGDLDRNLQVTYLISGDAVPGVDYRTLSGSVTIPAGLPSAQISVQPRNNNTKDGGHTVTLLLANSPSYNVGFPDSADVFIADGSVPALSISAAVATTAEGGAGQFVISRTGNSSQGIWVNLQASGTAKPIADYVALPDRVFIPAGSNSITINATAVADQLSEDTESIVLGLLPGTNYTLFGLDQATVTVTDSGGGLPGVGFDSQSSSAPESSGMTQIPVTVSVNPPGPDPVIVDWKVVGGTAVPDVDYVGTNASGRLMFPSDGTKALQTALIQIPLLDNTNFQPNRTIVLALVSPGPDYSNVVVTNIVSDTNTPPNTTTNIVTNLTQVIVPMNGYFDAYTNHVFTILDDDAAVVSVIATTGVANETTGTPGVFTLSRVGPTNRTQNVLIQLSGLAANGSDYEFIDSTVTFPIGWQSIDVPVIPVQNPVQQYSEDVTLTIDNVPGGQIDGTAGAATIYIVNNEGTIEFTQPSFQVPEGIGVAQIPIRRSGDTNSTFSVKCAITAGTAIAGLDFVATNVVVTFAPGEAQKSVPVIILNNTLIQPSRTVLLALSNASDGSPLGGQSFATVTILDDDDALEFSQPSFLVNENGTNAVITIQRVGNTTNVSTVTLVATDGVGTNAAVGGVDFVATNLTVTLASGQSSATALVRILDNSILSGNHVASLYLTNATGASLTNETAQLVIVDDECSFQFSEAASSVEEYARSITLTVYRTGGTVNPVSVGYSTTPGTAKPNKDYQPVSGTLTFAGDAFVPRGDGSGIIDFVPGETNKTFDIRIFDDNIGQGDRLFTAVLANPKTLVAAKPNSATLGTPAAAGVTILDDETPGNVDFSFNPGEGADGRVLAVALQSDGKVLIGGQFNNVDGNALGRLARLQPDAYVDSSFSPGIGVGGEVDAIAVQSDGRILVGGDFTTYNGSPASRIARLNGDGSVDPDFNIGTGADGAVHAILAQPDTTIYLGGGFGSINGGSRPGVARLLATGDVDPGFSSAGVSGGDVLAMAVMGDGSLLVGGSFSGIGGSARSYLAHLSSSGVYDSAFGKNSALNGAVNSIAVQSDGRIVIGGEFTSVGTVSLPYLARLNSDGTFDSSFNTGTGPNAIVHGVGLTPDGKVIVAGAFTNLNNYVGSEGFGLNRLARLDSAGAVDPAFDLGSGANDTIWTMLVQPDSAILIGGDFTIVRGLPRNRIARVHSDDKFVVSKIQFDSAFYSVPKNGTNATINVQRSGDLTGTVSVQYLTTNGTATAGVDYQTAAGTLTFNPGDTLQSFTVPIIDNKVPTGDQSVGLLLTNIPAGYSLNARLSAVLTIVDYESALGFTAAEYSVDATGGSATITVHRSGPTTSAITVDYSSTNGTATAGLDYTAVSGTLTFNAGATDASFSVPILNNKQANQDVTVLLSLSNPTGGGVLGKTANAVLTIVYPRVLFYSLNITPPVGGTVTPPSGRFAVGTNVVVTATPERDYAFDHWEGSTNTAQNPLSLVMNADYNLTAIFNATSLTYDFEPPFANGDLDRSPWSRGGNTPWLLESGVALSGSHAVRSGAIGDSQESSLNLVANCRAGAISFGVRVSSEANFDFLEFLVNGVKFDRWSGEVPWTTVRYELPAGNNTLTWRYSKDANFSSGLDGAFVDNLYVPLFVPDTTPAAAHLSVASAVAGNIQIQLTGKIGLTYTLQASTNLSTWIPVSTNTLSTTNIVIQDSQPVSLPSRFYRAITPGP